jgi:polysaccharide biosynthesis transport protein
MISAFCERVDPISPARYRSCPINGFGPGDRSGTTMPVQDVTNHMDEQRPELGPGSSPGHDLTAPGPTRFMLDEPGFEPMEEEAGLDPRRILAAVFRYKWLILLVMILGTGAGVFLARQVQLQYVAQATIWIEAEGREREAGPIRSGELLQSFAWVDLLRSYVVLDHVVLEEQLYLEYPFAMDSVLFRDFALLDSFRPGAYRLSVSQTGRYALELMRSGVIETGQLGDSVGRAAGFQWTPPAAGLLPGRTVEFTVRPPRDAALRLSERLQARLPERNGNFLRLELPGTDPVQTARVLNVLSEQYVQVAASLKKAKLEELTAILDEQLRYAEDNLRQAEMELEAFRVQTITLPSDPSTPVTPGLEATRDPVFQSFFDVRIEREELRRDRDAIAAALADTRADGSPLEQLWAIGAVRNSAELSRALAELNDRQAELRAALGQYTEEHGQVRRLQESVDELRYRVIPRLAGIVVEQLDQRDRVLASRIDAATGELRGIPPRMIEEARLRRRVSIAGDLYENLQARYESARLAAASSIADVRILDRASVPFEPVNPAEAPRLLILAFVGSLGLGLAGAVLRDRMDRRVRYPDQVARFGVAMLGTIPFGGKGRRKDSAEMAQVLESFRVLRLNLLHAYGTSGPLVLTVTSPAVGDGKSFVSSNLALAFADLGYRTVVVDGDIRRGSLHTIFGGERSPGLTDYLAGKVPRAAVMQKTLFPSLDIIRSGTWRRAGPELLSGNGMLDLLATLKSDYRVIIVDSPPLGAGADAYVLGSVTGHMLLVLRTGKTDGELTEAKLEPLNRLPIRTLGAVLNAVPAGGPYQYYSYDPAYQLAQVTEERASVVLERA